MTEQQKAVIKQTLNSQGWVLIEQMLNDEANEVKKIKTEGRKYQDIAVECIANDKIEKTIKSLLRKLNVIKSGATAEPTRYV